MYVYVRGYMVGMALLLEMCIALFKFQCQLQGRHVDLWPQLRVRGVFWHTSCQSSFAFLNH